MQKHHSLTHSHTWKRGSLPLFCAFAFQWFSKQYATFSFLPSLQGLTNAALDCYHNTSPIQRPFFKSFMQNMVQSSLFTLVILAQTFSLQIAFLHTKLWSNMAPSSLIALRPIPPTRLLVATNMTFFSASMAPNGASFGVTSLQESFTPHRLSPIHMLLQRLRWLFGCYLCLCEFPGSWDREGPNSLGWSFGL